MHAENSARLSAATQAEYGAAEAAGSERDWLEVTDALQRSVVEAAGVPPERRAAALWLLRSAAQLWPADEEPRRASLWVRHNRAAAGTLRVGDAAPELPLHPVGTPARPALGAHGASSVARACAGKPTLLVAGSWS